MKKLIYTMTLAVVSFTGSYAQKTNPANEYKPKFGLKGGFNWTYLTGSKEGFTPNTKTGFMVGGFYSTTTNGLGFRSEIVFSRQGYSYDDGGHNTDILNDYIYLPQFTTFTIAKVVQFQLGAQIGFLVNAKKKTESKDRSISDLMNKVDYGFAGGVELYPIKWLIIGGRYNLGLGKLYKHYEDAATNPNTYPLPFNPETTNLKNGVVQFYVGVKL